MRAWLADGGRLTLRVKPIAKVALDDSGRRLHAADPTSESLEAEPNDEAMRLEQYDREGDEESHLGTESAPPPPGPRCRCFVVKGARCKCGLSDALGVREENRGQKNPWAALRVGNLTQNVDEETLFNFLSIVSPVETVKIVRNAVTFESECHAFVNFRTFNDAQEVLQKMNGKPLEGRPLALSWSSRARNLMGEVPGISLETREAR
mmetsp:Transcript_28126/g.42482  ORF Transcript_28126/g.42482 Transcript_28126/m.42482 type:complete len:207 (+) Transcript_28126:2-622(+)